MPPYEKSNRPMESEIPRNGQANFTPFIINSSNPHENVFEELPSIRKFISGRNAHQKQPPELIVKRIAEKDTSWLANVMEEVNSIVPVGSMSQPIWLLVEGLMKCLEKQNNTNAGKLSIELLGRLLKEEDCTDRKVNAVMYNVAMRSTPISAEKIFKILLERHSMKPTRSAPVASNRASMIVGMAKNGQVQQAQKLLWLNAPVSLYNTVLQIHEEPEAAESLLVIMEEHLHYDTNGAVKPNVNSFLIVIKKWAGVDANRTQALMDRLLIWSKAQKSLRPTVDCFVNVMRAFTLARRPIKVDQWMKRLKGHIGMLASQFQDKPEYTLSSTAFLLQMQAWAGRHRPDKLEPIIKDMQHHGIQPLPSCWSLLVKSWIQHGNVSRAEQVIREMPQVIHVSHCNLVLQGWCARNKVSHAHQFLNWMSQQQNEECQPDTESYSVLLEGWKKSNHADATACVVQLLRRMEQDIGKSSGRVEPTRELFEAAINTSPKGTDKLEVAKAWVRHLSPKRETRKPSKFDADSTAVTIRSPSEGTGMSELLSELAKSKAGPKEASSHCSFGNKSLEAVQELEARRLQKRIQIKKDTDPDAQACNAVLAISLSNCNPKASEIACSMILQMIQAYQDGDTSMLLCPIAFTRLFTNLYTPREKISCKAALDMIEAVKDFPDETFAYASFKYGLTVCAWSRHEDAASCAHKIWMKVEKQSVELLNLVLKTYANHPRDIVSRQNVVKLLEDIENNTQIVPNKESYALVIEAVAKSKVSNGAQKSLHLMQQFYDQLTNQALSHVLHACAISPAYGMGAKLHNYNIANRAFQVWRSRGGTVSSHHYLLLLTCAIRLAPDPKSRSNMTLRVFQQCACHGMVDTKILRRFWSLASREVRQSLLRRNEDNVPLSALPQDWTKDREKNVNEAI